MLICGDFNLNLLRVQSDDNIAHFYDIINTLSLIPTITKPTKLTDNSQTLIDNIFISKPFNYVSGILTFDISDHFPIFVIFKDYFIQSTTNQTIEYRLINETSMQKMHHNLSIAKFHEILDSDDCYYAIEILNEMIPEEYNTCCPIKTKAISAMD